MPKPLCGPTGSGGGAPPTHPEGTLASSRLKKKHTKTTPIPTASLAATWCAVGAVWILFPFFLDELASTPLKTPSSSLHPFHIFPFISPFRHPSRPSLPFPPQGTAGRETIDGWIPGEKKGKDEGMNKGRIERVIFMWGVSSQAPGKKENTPR